MLKLDKGTFSLTISINKDDVLDAWDFVGPGKSAPPTDEQIMQILEMTKGVYENHDCALQTALDTAAICVRDSMGEEVC